MERHLPRAPPSKRSSVMKLCVLEVRLRCGFGVSAGDVREELEQYMTAIELARPRFFRDATKHLRTSAEQDIPSLMPGVVE